MKDTGKTAGLRTADHDESREPDNRALRQKLTKFTRGGPPISTMTMMNDWALHLAAAPDKQLSLMKKAQENWFAWSQFVMAGCPDDPEASPIAPQKGDRRFSGEAWAKAPFAALAQGFLLAENFADHATSDVPGLTPAHDASMTFLARQLMGAFAPSNFLMTNPEALSKTIETRGENLQNGGAAFLRDWQALTGQDALHPPSRVGKDLAVSRGKVVLRTHLMELIQYEPTTDKVHPEPILIVPAWIMKYYILDLSPENSVVRYLTDQGFTVFMMSWRNPDAADADLGMADYLEQGPRAALDHICTKTKAKKVHGVGYCLGGTLLSIAAASMARDGDDRLASMTLLAAQTDFSEAGELMMFINESQVSFLEDLMASQGYLEATQMMSAFQMMRSNDLIWSRMVRTYLLGDDEPAMNDLMAWNADSTRMPARMHSEYLRQMFLNNDLATGRYAVDGHAVSLRDIRIPVFGVGTETDHIAPWKSVFKIHALGHADVTFALTNGGHNAGVLSEPGHKRRHFRVYTTRDQDRALTPDDWLETAKMSEGSWWPAWTKWLGTQSSEKALPPKMTGDLSDAPGTYVMME
ncbi:PHA/PHB synthase family protein [Sedimentitalea nanhaiensis]|uniref:Polyhydroxyalkanoate synthase n=1 Tax=Sedimentitalea nanhaiensis TaxID=999627 RepID=A0A1I7ECT2_9RHOB|nr:alpha/beta fold hydrolase [Sedimentitalea nanhaiensis]SFU21751.1 polyhydroxyalkanoate synthase [Sedimentitalea nanhaiensis]